MVFGASLRTPATFHADPGPRPACWKTSPQTARPKGSSVGEGASLSPPSTLWAADHRAGTRGHPQAGRRHAPGAAATSSGAAARVDRPRPRWRCNTGGSRRPGGRPAPAPRSTGRRTRRRWRGWTLATRRRASTRSKRRSPSCRRLTRSRRWQRWVGGWVLGQSAGNVGRAALMEKAARALRCCLSCRRRSASAPIRPTGRPTHRPPASPGLPLPIRACMQLREQRAAVEELVDAVVEGYHAG